MAALGTNCELIAGLETLGSGDDNLVTSVKNLKHRHVNTVLCSHRAYHGAGAPRSATSTRCGEPLLTV